MELTWELESLYPGFQSEKFRDDRELSGRLAAGLKAWSAVHLNDEQNAAERTENFLKQYNAYKSVYICLFSYAELRYSAEGGNEEAAGMMDELEETAAEADEGLACFGKWLNHLDGPEFARLLESSAYLGEHSFYLRGLREQSRYRLGEEAEAAIARMKLTGSKAWERLYMQTLSTLRTEVELQGSRQSLSLSELRNLAYEADPAVRAAAAAAEHEACRSVAGQSAACLNAVTGEAAAIYELRGYASPLHKVLAASRMDERTLAVMLETVAESLPVFHRYYAKKAELLGHAGALPFHDVFAPLGAEQSGRLSYREAAEIISSAFSSFSEELGGFARTAFERRWIDAEPRSGKGSFGMCVDIFPLGESRIITSFTGQPVDVSVLAHEIGHAYHSSCLAGQSMLNTDYPVPVAETASIFCESLVHQELLNRAAAGTDLALLERSLSDSGYYIVDFYARYLFESRLYEKRRSGPLSVEELNGLMLESMTAAYGDSVEPGSIHPYQWISKAGYYMAGNEFLNFPYSFGLLFSKGLYAQYKKQGGDFAGRYRSFLAATGTANIRDAALLLDIDVHSPDFWRGALQLIAGEVREFAERA
ncbi:M3 family oligoendopeptidase ['Paenibacillus yunnanensis' Narsing Rao et al. 2020]|uniref:M3 family oligoendopeptidase n=1 Tax=Paenibacillus tengchongensis TaxID=2608684 RepID=UPI00124CC3BD|nr:M3 family oligoendopeptidase [Paenibacillus tengchongensis]